MILIPIFSVLTFQHHFLYFQMLNRLSTNFSDKKCLDNFKAIVKSVDNSVAKLLQIE